MLPHIGNRRPGKPNLGLAVLYQASQVKKRVRRGGIIRAICGSPLNICMCFLVIVLMGSGGVMYGFMINHLDDGKVEHWKNGGFWGRKSNITITAVTNGTLSSMFSDTIKEKPVLKRNKNFKLGIGDPILGAPGSSGEQQQSDKTISSEHASSESADGQQQVQTQGEPGAGDIVQGGQDGVASEGNRELPRGADPALKAKYVLSEGAEQVFECDKGTKIDIAKVNDDFCDCLDGSDEPGTSACDNGTFFCEWWSKTWKQGMVADKHAGLHSSRVNDGVCDCCDGSDEWNRSDITCPNTCKPA